MRVPPIGGLEDAAFTPDGTSWRNAGRGRLLLGRMAVWLGATCTPQLPQGDLQMDPLTRIARAVLVVTALSATTLASANAPAAGDKPEASKGSGTSAHKVHHKARKKQANKAHEKAEPRMHRGADTPAH